MLPQDKSLIGFVGGPWTLLRFATGKTKETLKYEDFHMEYMKNVISPLLKMNIGLQLQSGAEIVMIFDSNLYDLDSLIFNNQYFALHDFKSIGIFEIILSSNHPKSPPRPCPSAPRLPGSSEYSLANSAKSEPSRS